MASEFHAVRRFDRAPHCGQEMRQNLGKGALADEADARAVRLVEDRQSGTARAFANRTLFHVAEWHQRALELRARDGMQEVALILRSIERLVQLDARGRAHEAGVV